MFDEKFWIAISFLLLIILLYKKLANIISTALNNKSIAIEDQLKQASLIKLEAQEIRDNYLKQKKENMITAQKIIDNAEKQAKKLISESDKELKTLIEQKLNQAEALIKEIEIKEMNDVRIKAIEHSVEKFKDFIANGKYDKKLYNSSIALFKKAI